MEIKNPIVDEESQVGTNNGTRQRVPQICALSDPGSIFNTCVVSAFRPGIPKD